MRRVTALVVVLLVVAVVAVPEPLAGVVVTLVAVPVRVVVLVVSAGGSVLGARLRIEDGGWEDRPMCRLVSFEVAHVIAAVSTSPSKPPSTHITARLLIASHSVSSA